MADRPHVEIIDEEPPPGWVEAARMGIEDIEAGRSVVCHSAEEFDRLLAAAPAAICAVHRRHSPAPLRLVVHHIWPLAMGGPDRSDNWLTVCDTGHYNIHRLLGSLIRGEQPPRGHRDELVYARRGFDQWDAAGRPGRPVFELAPGWVEHAHGDG